MFLPHHRHRATGWAGWAIIAVLLILVPFGCTVSQAQPAAPSTLLLNPAACAQLYALAEAFAKARDHGVPHERLAERLKIEMAGMGVPYVFGRIVLQELQRVYTSGLAPDAAGADVYARCMTGPLGGEDV